MVICLERGADLHMAQLMPLPLTVSCFSKIQIGFTFLVPAYPGSPGQRAVKRVCVLYVCYWHALTVCGAVSVHLSGVYPPICLSRFAKFVAVSQLAGDINRLMHGTQQHCRQMQVVPHGQPM